MRALTFAFGNLLFLLGVAGMIIVAVLASLSTVGAVHPLPVLQAMRAGGPGAAVAPPGAVPPPAPAATPEPVQLAQPVTADTGAVVADDPHVITSVRIARIGLDAPSVLAPLVQVAGGTTWEVPAYKAGHGEYSAGAGQPGNAVLMGHVTSLNAGNVFRDLERVKAGDVVEVGSGAGTFTYRVTEVRVVPRTDLSVVQPTETPTLSLITCAGAWLPQISEFAERLVVRAELVTA